MSGAHEGGAPHEAGGAVEPGAVADPSMDDILASIRRILNEEDAKPLAPEGGLHEGAGPDVLELDETMMLPEEGAEAPVPVPVPVPAPAPVVAAPPAAPLAVPFPPAPALVAPEAAAAAAVSVGTLMRTLATERTTAVHRGGPTIEDLVREEIRPLLKEWLDAHLPEMVERLVRAEIERVVSRTS